MTKQDLTNKYEIKNWHVISFLIGTIFFTGGSFKNLNVIGQKVTEHDRRISVVETSVVEQRVYMEGVRSDLSEIKGLLKRRIPGQ